MRFYLVFEQNITNIAKKTIDFFSKFDNHFFIWKQCAAVCFIAISQDTFYFLRMCAGRQTIVFLKNWNRKIVQRS